MRINRWIVSTIVLLTVIALGLAAAPRAGALTQTAAGSFDMDCSGFTITGAGD